VSRRFEPHLSSMNLGFSLNSRSGIFRWLGFGGSEDTRGSEADDEVDSPEDPFADDEMLGEGAMIPTGVGGTRVAPQRSRSEVGEWNVSLQYALQRPRNEALGDVSQMLSGTLRVSPTENWDLSWRTSYDLEEKGFNDHVIRLTRDLHRWEANFDFLQTATGNWSFRFEVSLQDNRDLKFDYRQRNLNVRTPTSGSGGR